MGWEVSSLTCCLAVLWSSTGGGEAPLGLWGGAGRDRWGGMRGGSHATSRFRDRGGGIWAGGTALMGTNVERTDVERIPTRSFEEADERRLVGAVHLLNLLDEHEPVSAERGVFAEIYGVGSGRGTPLGSGDRAAWRVPTGWLSDRRGRSGARAWTKRDL